MSKIVDLLDNLPYGPAPEDASLAHEWIGGRTFGSLIGGRWVSSDQTFATVSPADGQALAQISQATSDQVNQAVESAREALEKWQRIGPQKRAELLYALARGIQKHARLFAVLESLDNGKPIRETRDIDIPLAARHFYSHAGWAKLVEQEFADHEPVGVCGQIIPWNFPLLMLAWKIAPALAAGNTCILKPAEFTPLTALRFAELCQEVGIPDGVVNIVTGDGEVGRMIVEHPEIDKIAFTGSTEVGRIIRRATAGTTKRLSLELGGKSPFIVYEHADLDSAVEGLVDAIWFNQGQVCCAGSRLLVQESVAEELYHRIRARLDTLRVGHSLDKAVDIGAIVDETQLARIRHLVEVGVSEGASCHQPECELPSNGFYFPPTLLTNVEPSSTVAQVEIFGPVLVAMTFRTPEEAIALANNTTYGLASSVWTQDIDTAHDAAARIKAGVVWINCTNQFDANAGFGGYRESGFGREGGREGLAEYLKLKMTEAPTFESLAVKPPTIDRTNKLYIGGKQTRPDGGYSFSRNGHEFALANRKDLRNAVEATCAAQPGWNSAYPAVRAQILYYLAENMAAARDQFKAAGIGEQEFNQSVELIFDCAAWCDKFEGAVHSVPMRALVYTKVEPLGSLVSFAPETPALYGFLASSLPAIAMGNAVVSVASDSAPLPAAELVRIIEASDFPAGVWNILSAERGALLDQAASHLGVDAIWLFGTGAEAEILRERSAGNLKQTWAPVGLPDPARHLKEFLRRATQVKNIWVPYGA